MKSAPALLLLCVALPALAQHEGHHQPPQPEPATQHEHHEQAPADPPAPSPAPSLPEPTAAERAAAFPDLGGMDMRDHMDEDPWIATLQVDELEWQDAGNAAGLGWNVRGWAGGIEDRIWLRSEGERRDGSTERGDIELLWGRPAGPWWDVVAGVRHEFGHGPARDWLALGVQGLAPYKFEIEATGYLGPSGRTAFNTSIEYEVLLTNRLILQPELEVELHGRDDRERGIGAGLSQAEFGLRLRYEVHRQVAPYLGYVWSRKFGRTADFARDLEGSASESMWVAGLRFWF